MARGVAARENCPKDILITLLDGPKGFEQIVSALKKDYSRGTINKYLNELYETGLITREGRRGSYKLTTEGKIQAEKEVMKQEQNRRIDNASPEEFEKMKKELEHYKRLDRIKELEKFPLPLTATIKKLCSLGFKNEDVENKVFKYWTSKYRPTEHYEPELIPFKLIDEEFSQDDIEVKLIPKSEVESWLNTSKIEGLINNSKIDNVDKYIWFITQIEEKFGKAWQILTYDPINGYYVIGAYKELIKLYCEEFEYQWLNYKEKFNLTDEDWKIMGPYVAWLMLSEAGRFDLPIMITEGFRECVSTHTRNSIDSLKDLD
ncbi:hypothetical protein H5T51_03185, partial [Candidatus Bathyarchaeota archaeon]|nr:hypothetical protein [Candidatus Bathyarchaeota archaeon]